MKVNDWFAPLEESTWGSSSCSGAAQEKEEPQTPVIKAVWLWEGIPNEEKFEL